MKNLKKIKLAIGGSHSTGKSTFLNRLKEILKKEKINYRLVSDLAIVCPLPILHNHTIESTLWIATKNINEELEAEYNSDVILVDRSICDSWVYFKVACGNKYAPDNQKLITLYNVINNWIPTYDLIFQTVLNENIKIEDNKGRDLDPEYRKKIHDEFINANKLFNINPRYLSTNNVDLELEFTINHIKSIINK